MGKNVHPGHGAGIRTHNMNINLLPHPLDQGSRPSFGFVTNTTAFHLGQYLEPSSPSAPCFIVSNLRA